jgi:hypothetical protein
MKNYKSNDAVFTGPPSIEDQMADTAQAYDHLADLLQNDPTSEVNGL